MKKKFAGYINLKPLNGVIYPSSIQNILMKNFIENNLGGMFYLSPTELLQAKYSITLKSLISKETNVSGIVMLSTFLLPRSYKERESVYKRLLISKKKMYLPEENFKPLFLDMPCPFVLVLFIIKKFSNLFKYLLILFNVLSFEQSLITIISY